MINKEIDKKVLWAPAVILLICLIVTYWQTIGIMIDQWLDNQDYSHGILVPFITAYLIWAKRKDFAQLKVGTDWRALTLMFAAFCFLVIGRMATEFFTTRFSMVIFIFGVTWFVYGPKMVKALLFPLGFLVLMIPLPKLVHSQLTFPLQLLSSKGAVSILNMLDIIAYREGNIIDIGFMQLQVVEACNGLRYILPLLTLGVLFAYFGQKIFWKRILLIVATVPVAILSNMLRISGTAVIGIYWGSKAAEGFFHSFSGWAVFMISIGIFTLINRCLNFIPDFCQTSKKDHHSATAKIKSRSVKWTSTALALFIVIMSHLIANYLTQIPPVPIRKPLKEFPIVFEGWKGEQYEMEPEMWKLVNAQDYVLANYHKEGANPINFYVSYYQFTEKAGDLVHTPRMCLPGAGWEITRSQVRIIPQKSSEANNIKDLHVNELIVTKERSSQVTYFWYQGRGRHFTNEYLAKFYRIWDGIFRRRNDGAAIRIITPLEPGQSIEEIRKYMDPFALAAFNELKNYIP